MPAELQSKPAVLLCARTYRRSAFAGSVEREAHIPQIALRETTPMVALEVPA